VLTKISSLGLWVPIHDEEWNGDLPRPLTDEKKKAEEDNDCGEVVFKKDTLPWRAGEYEVISLLLAIWRIVIANGRDRFDITRTGSTTSLRMWHQYRFTVRRMLSPPFTQPLRLIKLARIVDRPDALDFPSIRCWLLKIVTLALDSDPSLIPRSSILPGMNGNFEDDEDDFRFWSERQAQRIAQAIRTVLDIEFAPEVIVADANISALTRRILTSKQLLGP